MMARYTGRRRPKWLLPVTVALYILAASMALCVEARAAEAVLW